MKHYCLSIVVTLIVTLFTVTSAVAQTDNSAAEKRTVILEILANTGLDKYSIAVSVKTSSVKAAVEKWVKEQKELSELQIEELTKLAIQAGDRADQGAAKVFDDKDAIAREYQAGLVSQFEAGLTIDELRDLADYSKKASAKNSIKFLLEILNKINKKAGEDVGRKLKTAVEKIVTDEMRQLKNNGMR